MFWGLQWEMLWWENSFFYAAVFTYRALNPASNDGERQETNEGERWEGLRKWQRDNVHYWCVLSQYRDILLLANLGFNSHSQPRSTFIYLYIYIFFFCEKGLLKSILILLIISRMTGKKMIQVTSRSISDVIPLYDLWSCPFKISIPPITLRLKPKSLWNTALLRNNFNLC